MSKKNKKTKIIEKKVYKANTKALKKLGIATIVLFLIIILAVPVKNGITYLYLKTWIWHDISNYSIKIKLPRAYQEIKRNNQFLDIASSLIETNTSVKINEGFNVQRPEVVYYGGNILNGISVMVQCLNTSKTTRTLDEIADNQHVLVRIYYEDDYKISEPEKEYVTILNTESVKTSTTLTNEKETKMMINYLVPMEDKEVTITFMGDSSRVEKNLKEIEDIVKQMKSLVLN